MMDKLHMTIPQDKNLFDIGIYAIVLSKEGFFGEKQVLWMGIADNIDDAYRLASDSLKNELPDPLSMFIPRTPWIPVTWKAFTLKEIFEDQNVWDAMIQLKRRNEMMQKQKVPVIEVQASGTPVLKLDKNALMREIVNKKDTKLFKNKLNQFTKAEIQYLKSKLGIKNREVM